MAHPAPSSRRSEGLPACWACAHGETAWARLSRESWLRRFRGRYFRCMTMTSVTEFFGWCTVINGALLMLTTLVVWTARERILGIHTRMFGASASELGVVHVQYLSNYKIAILVLNLVPYVALRVMG